MAKKPKNQNKTKSNPILWFLFVIVVPLIVALTIITVIFTVAGFNVIDWAKNTGNNIPVLSSVISTDEEDNKQQTEQTFKDKLTKKDKKIDELKKNVTNLEETVEQLEQEIAKQENAEPTTEMKEEETEKDSVEEKKNSQLLSMTASFEQMDPEQSALILQGLEESMVIEILKGLPEDVRAGILESMEPEKAAQYTKAYLSSPEQ